MKRTPPYRPASSIQIMCQALGRYNVDANEVLSDSGLSFLVDGNKSLAREVTVVDIDRFSALAVERTGDPTLGLQVGKYVGPATFQSLGLAMISSPTLRDFCQLLDKHFTVLILDTTVKFHESNSNAQLSLEPPPDCYCETSYRVWIDGFFSTWVSFIRSIYKPQFHPLKITLRSPDNDGLSQKYRDHFGCPVIFSSQNNAIHFDKSDLDAALHGGNHELMLYNEQFISKILDKTDSKDIKSAVAARIRGLLFRGTCTKHAVANALGLSERTLEKRLSHAETSYQTLLNNVRKDLAYRYLRTTDYSLTQISYLLGFSDSANFTRAFKQWTEQSPSDFRNSLPKQD